mmetsp:Transcript_4622/g.14854  ORF Transcript_4622/g.14854 Transcript_4622/m.14854 type:complete len:80 (-) Transcript_4622:600-839(-)
MMSLGEGDRPGAARPHTAFDRGAEAVASRPEPASMPTPHTTMSAGFFCPQHRLLRVSSLVVTTPFKSRRPVALAQPIFS